MHVSCPPAPIPESVYIQGDAPWWPRAAVACDHHVPWFVKHRSIRALPLSSCVTLSWSRTSLASVSACEAVAMTSSSRAWEKQGWPRVSAQLSARHTDRHLGVSGLRAPALLTRGGPADFLPLPQGRMELGAQHIGRTGCPGQVPPLPCLSWACCLLCARVGTQQ